MIMLYFSGTGNSKYIAELFSQTMDALCHSIEESLDFGTLIEEHEVIGFCYPVYGSRVPRILREFVAAHMPSLERKKLIIFCTQVLFSGDGARAFTDLFPRDFVQVIYAEHVFMPNNICNLFLLPLESEKKVKAYFTKAEQKMAGMCQEIKAGIVKKRGFNPVSRALGLTQAVFWPFMEKRARTRVWIGANCNGCLLCVSLCPMQNFAPESGKVAAKQNCTVCYRCINNCPQKAISVFLRGKVKTQYKGVLPLRYLERRI